MKVVVDSNPLYTSQAGVCRYVEGLLSGLGDHVPHVDVIECGWPVMNLDFKQPMRAARTIYRELIWSRCVARSMVRESGCDVYHRTSNVAVDVPDGSREVVTLYDLAVLRNPTRFRPWHRHAWQRDAQRLHSVDKIVCISKFTAEEAMQLLEIDATKLEVVYCGTSLADKECEGDVPIPSSVPAEYFLFVGSIEPGKNLSMLIDVYDLAKEKGRTLPPLVIVGARWAGVEGESEPPTDWVYLGRQSDVVLKRLYESARALVFPSKYEGFGLPVVEAMISGCPVICSPVASLPEVGGDAVLFSKMDPESYMKAMELICSDGGARDECVTAGREQAKKFSWSRCAEETVSVYESVL